MFISVLTNTNIIYYIIYLTCFNRCHIIPYTEAKRDDWRSLIIKSSNVLLQGGLAGIIIFTLILTIPIIFFCWPFLFIRSYVILKLKVLFILFELSLFLRLISWFHYKKFKYIGYWKQFACKDRSISSRIKFVNR